MKYFAIFDKNVATIFQLQWNIGNIPDIFLHYSVLCGQYTDNEIDFFNLRSLYAVYAWNCAHAFTWAREWKNLIVADDKLPKRDFDFYCLLLHTISVVNSKFFNYPTNILCSIPNSRPLKPTILQFSFIFIEFRYSLSISISQRPHCFRALARSLTPSFYSTIWLFARKKWHCDNSWWS